MKASRTIGGLPVRGVWQSAVAGLIFFAAGLTPAANAQAAAPMKLSVPVLMVSDIHFDPFMGTDGNTVAALSQAQIEDWDKIFAKHFVGRAKWGRRFDTSYQLLQSSLTAIGSNAGGVRFVTVSGDLLAHDFDSQFYTTCGNANCGELGNFAAKTVAYVLYVLRKTLPGVPVYAALGNNDSPCHDYRLTPGSDFLKQAGKSLTADVPAGELAQAEIDFSGAGYYRVTLPAPMEHTQLLVMDDIFLATNYTPCPGGQPNPPAGKPVPLIGGPQFKWLEGQLKDIRADKKNDAKAWVMGHMPSGVDPYGTVHNQVNVCGGVPPVMFLPSPDPNNPDAPDQSQAVISQFGDVIRLAIFAHSHMDELRVLPGAQAGDLPVAMKLVPSISPFNGNNPSITIAMVDPATATLMDYRVIAASNKTGVQATWTKTYEFDETYGIPAGQAGLSAVALNKLIANFSSGADPTQDASYRQYYSTGGLGYLTATNWHEYVCLMNHFAPSDFTKCTCATAH